MRVSRTLHSSSLKSNYSNLWGWINFVIEPKGHFKPLSCNFQFSTCLKREKKMSNTYVMERAVNMVSLEWKWVLGVMVGQPQCVGGEQRQSGQSCGWKVFLNTQCMKFTYRWQANEHAQFDFCILFKIVGMLAYLNKEKIIIKKIDSHILKNACDTTERLSQFHKGRFPNCYSLIRFTQSTGTP